MIQFFGTLFAWYFLMIAVHLYLAVVLQKTKKERKGLNFWFHLISILSSIIITVVPAVFQKFGDKTSTQKGKSSQSLYSSGELFCLITKNEKQLTGHNPMLTVRELSFENYVR